VFNAIFNNISCTCISWQPVLLVGNQSTQRKPLCNYCMYCHVHTWMYPMVLPIICFKSYKNISPLTLMSSNPVHGDVYSIQHYLLKFVSDLRQVGGFLQFPPLIGNITDHHAITEILLKVVLNTITLTHIKKKKSDFLYKNSNMIIFLSKKIKNKLK
jgi:hypothetical protein